MNTPNSHKNINTKLRAILSITLIAAFIGSSLILPQAEAGEMVMPLMPAPGTMVNLSAAYTPAYLQGITIHADNALQFDFLINKGEGHLNNVQKRIEYNKLIKYFLASLTIPDEDQWVNLSPYEHSRVIKDDFGKTEMGRDLLTQDYLLKQITVSLVYPKSGLGKKFWDRIYEKAGREYGSVRIPVDTFNKVWITPDEAMVYESGKTAYVIKSHLKVMLEEDYLSLKKHRAIITDKNNTHTLASKIVKEIILPEIEKEVNEGKNFAMLRQIYSGMILATWYKRALKESLLGQVYADKARTKGVDQDPRSNQAIYRKYVEAFKKGVFNYIKEDADTYSGQAIPRKYFAGGWAANPQAVQVMPVSLAVLEKTMMTDRSHEDDAMVNVDPAMNARQLTSVEILSFLEEMGSTVPVNHRVIQDHDDTLNYKNLAPDEVQSGIRAGTIVALIYNNIPQFVFKNGLGNTIVLPPEEAVLSSQIIKIEHLNKDNPRLIIHYQGPITINLADQLPLRIVNYADADDSNRSIPLNPSLGFYIIDDEDHSKSLRDGEVVKLGKSARYAEGFRALTNPGKEYDGVSRMHITITRKGTTIILEDGIGESHSANGTTVTYPQSETSLTTPKKFSLSSGFLIDTTKEKGVNEDSGFVDAKAGVAVALDGVGGAGHGDMASRLAKEKLEEIITQEKLQSLLTIEDQKSFLIKAVQEANHAIREHIRQNPETKGMATTISMFVIWKEPLTDRILLVGANIGDSRLYLRNQDGTLEQLSRDDSTFGVLVAGGHMTLEQAETSKGRNIINDALGIDDEKLMEEHQIIVREIHPGDIIFAVSDGISDNLGHKGIQHLIGNINDPQQLAEVLMQKAKQVSTHPNRNLRSKYEENRTKRDDMLVAALRVDPAMNVKKPFVRHDNASTARNGGIDLNSANLNLLLRRDGKGVPLPLAQQDMAQLSNIQGFVPDIIEIRPVTTSLILSELEHKIEQSS